MGLFDGFSGSEEGLKNSAFEAIKAELDKQDMKYGEDVTEDGEDHIIRMRQQLDNGSVVSIAIVVTENGDTNDFIKIKYFGLVRLEENSDPKVFHEKLNEWNSQYRYVKFVVDDDRDVVVDIDLPLDLIVVLFCSLVTTRGGPLLLEVELRLHLPNTLHGLSARVAGLVVAHRGYGHLRAGRRRGRHPTTTVTPARAGRRHTRLHRDSHHATTIIGTLRRTRHLRRGIIISARKCVRARRTKSHKKQTSKRNSH